MPSPTPPDGSSIPATRSLHGDDADAALCEVRHMLRRLEHLTVGIRLRGSADGTARSEAPLARTDGEAYAGPRVEPREAA